MPVTGGNENKYTDVWNYYLNFSQCTGVQIETFHLLPRQCCVYKKEGKNMDIWIYYNGFS